VLYIRERTPNQTKLLETQEMSLGVKREKNPASTNKSSKNEEQLIEKTLQLLEEEKPGIRTYSQKIDYDFKSEFKLEFPNFIFNAIILIVMTLQIFWFLDLDTSLMRQSWKQNQHFKEETNVKIEDIKSYILSRLEESVIQRNCKFLINLTFLAFDKIIIASLQP
jgi:hypothetical protein